LPSTSETLASNPVFNLILSHSFIKLFTLSLIHIYSR
jgi:hypothetical protein